VTTDPDPPGEPSARLGTRAHRWTGEEIEALQRRLRPGGDYWEAAVARQRARQELEQEILRLSEPVEPPQHGIRAAWRALFS
jgi:hypothetical protein